VPGQAVLGVAVFGAGVVGLGLGAFFGVRALEAKGESALYCVGNDCEAAGVGLRSTALTNGNLSTAFLVGGVLAAAGGFALWWTAPSAQARVGVSAGPGTVVVRGDF